MYKLYQIDTGYACGGIVTKNDIVWFAAPIFKWMLNKHINDVKAWKKIKKIIEVS